MVGLNWMQLRFQTQASRRGGEATGTEMVAPVRGEVGTENEKVTQMAESGLESRASLTFPSHWDAGSRWPENQVPVFPGLSCRREEPFQAPGC